MSISLRLRKVDLEILADIDAEFSEGNALFKGDQLKKWSSFYDRVLTAEMKPKKKVGGVSVAGAIESFRGVLGKRLVMPAGNPGPAWWAQLQKRISDSGLTFEHCRAAAKIAGAQWKGGIKAESLIRQCDTLLSEANLESMGIVPSERQDMDEL